MCKKLKNVPGGEAKTKAGGSKQIAAQYSRIVVGAENEIRYGNKSVGDTPRAVAKARKTGYRKI